MILLTSAYLAPVQSYTKLFCCHHVVEERCDHFVKQTYRNRCLIAAESGPLALSIPIVHGDGLKPCTRDIRISDHGRWRSLHWNAIVSAYENSPFFDYYADDFRPFYEKSAPRFLVDFNEALEHTVCNLLEFEPQKTINDTSYMEPRLNDTSFIDLRETIRPKVSIDDPHFRPVAYYQVFAQRNGFLPNLSIIDLLFNMGPEARLVLRQSFRE